MSRGDRGGRPPIEQVAEPGPRGGGPTGSLYLWIGLDGALFVERGWDGVGAWVGSAELAADLDRLAEFGPDASVVYSREHPELDPQSPELVRTILHLITERHIPMQIRPDVVHPQVQAYLRKPGKFIHWAARNGRVDLLADLVSRGAPIHVRDGRGRTPLVLAVQRGHTDAVRLLLEAGANTRMLPDDGVSAIMVAAEGGLDEIAELLVEHGARPLAEGADGLTAADRARRAGHEDLAARLEQAGAGTRHSSRTDFSPAG